MRRLATLDEIVWDDSDQIANNENIFVHRYVFIVHRGFKVYSQCKSFAKFN